MKLLLSLYWPEVSSRRGVAAEEHHSPGLTQSPGGRRPGAAALPTGCFYPVVSSVGMGSRDTLCGDSEDSEKSPGKREWTFRHPSLSSSGRFG